MADVVIPDADEMLHARRLLGVPDDVVAPDVDTVIRVEFERAIAQGRRPLLATMKDMLGIKPL